ncbi:hypothetical protein EF917_15530 [Streptomyces sp. WAC00469]|nr:hypothetical protein EF917_15530 [Streptomyces sp. WAC00469]
MADLFAVHLALDLGPSAPSSVIETLRRHLDAGSVEEPDDDCEIWAPGFTSLLAERGPARRIGGVLTAELVQGEDRWSLTARQEIHAELRPELDGAGGNAGPPRPGAGRHRPGEVVRGLWSRTPDQPGRGTGDDDAAIRGVSEESTNCRRAARVGPFGFSSLRARQPGHMASP